MGIKLLTIVSEMFYNNFQSLRKKQSKREKLSFGNGVFPLLRELF
jgi:hypothetical protein